MTALLRSLVGHVLGYSTPPQVGAIFMRLTGLFALLSVALGLLFFLFGWRAGDPATGAAQPERFLVSGLLAYALLAAVWFAFGAGLTLVRHRGPTHNSDGLIVMLLIAVATTGWAVRGLVLIGQGAPLTEAIAWTGVKPWGAVSVEGSTIIARGSITQPFAAEIADALDAAPGASRLRIDSGGGSVGLADVIARRIRARGMEVVSDRYCASACLQIFFAGTRRALRPGARLGCHQAIDAISGRPAGPVRNFRDVTPPPDARALHAQIVRRCDATAPQDMFEPPLADLVRVNAVTHIEQDGIWVPSQAYCGRNPRRC